MSKSTDYLRPQPNLERRDKLESGDDLLTAILAPIAHLGFGRFREKVEEFEGDEIAQFGQQLRKFALFKQRIPGRVIHCTSHYKIEVFSLNVADAAIEHALAAYNLAKRKPVSVSEEKQHLEADGFSFKLLKDRLCDGVFEHLVGQCGFVYLQSRIEQDQPTNGEIWLYLGEPQKPEFSDDMFATGMVAVLKLEGHE